MSISFYNDIQKAVTPSVALLKLQTYLNRSEPQLIRWLYNTWNAQGQAITYKELREAILNGDITPEMVKDWNIDYSRFVTDHLLPSWEKSFEEAAKELSNRYPAFSFDPTAEGVREWTQTNAARFVTNVTTTQIEGLRAVVRRAALLDNMNVDDLGRVIRPMVGLTHQQTMANLNYYEKLIQNGVKESKAKEMSIKYSARQHRYRGQMIARTELAFAYNQGEDMAVRQAYEQGYMGKYRKIWCTADDERTCEICGGLEGKEIAMDETFDFKSNIHGETIKRVPPAHPHCRCAVIYEEIEPPKVDGTTPPTTEPQGEIDTPPEENPNQITFTPASSIKEANTYAQDVLGIPHANYSGTTVSIANEWNKGLTDTFNRFPELKANFEFVGTCQNRNKFMKKELYPYAMERFKRLNPGYTEKELDKAVKQWVAKKYAKPISADIWAQSSRQKRAAGITISDKHTGQAFLNSLKRNVESKFHPEGCDTVRSVLDHEIGHQIDDLLDLWDSPEIAKLYRSMTNDEMTQALSEYAWNNSNPIETREFVAEAWSEYMNNPSPRPVAKQVGEIIEEEYRKFKQRQGV